MLKWSWSRISIFLLFAIVAYGGIALHAGAAYQKIAAKTPAEPERLATLNALAPGGCVYCHWTEVAGYARSAMAHSMRVAGREPDGSVMVPGTSILVRSTSDGTWQQLIAGGTTATYRVSYVVGSGIHASGYFINLDHHLFQSPIAYYKARHAYGLAPGYEKEASPDFTRPISAGCVFCHADGATPVAGTANEYGSPVFTHLAIGCDRCHGSAAAHLEAPEAGNIVNPAKLKGAARDSVCEQCHLIGVARVLNPGKQFSDFHAGQPLEDTFTIYHNEVPAGEQANFRVISQSEQLSMSMCARNSGGKLWCGTCHDPHREPADPVAYYRSRCLTCHTGAFNAGHPSKMSDCISCHMPKRGTSDGAHTVFTDHRIQRRPNETEEIGSDFDIAAWRDPASDLEKRNLGIAEIQVGIERKSPKFIVGGYRLLTEVQQQFSGDSGLYTWMGNALLLGRQYGEAQLALERAWDLDPTSPAKEADFAQALVSGGKLREAQPHLEHALSEDSLDLSAATLLMQVYQQLGETDKATELSKHMQAAMQ